MRGREPRLYDRGAVHVIEAGNHYVAGNGAFQGDKRPHQRSRLEVIVAGDGVWTVSTKKRMNGGDLVRTGQQRLTSERKTGTAEF